MLAKLALLLFAAMALTLAHGRVASGGGLVLVVRRRLHGGRVGGHLTEHDLGRHQSAGIDVPLGRNPISTAGLYFTELEIGTPAETYHLQVDTMTGMMSLNCFNCDTCPSKNGFGMKLKLYVPTASQSASYVHCGDTFCAVTNSVTPYGCTPPRPRCVNTATKGTRVLRTGSLSQTWYATTKCLETVRQLRCGAKLAAGSPDQALDGILGFGQSGSSILSQLDAAGKARKIFAHCLDTHNGGGIFVVGNIVHPNMKTTGLVPNTSNYKINLKSIDVDGTPMLLPPDAFIGNGKGTIIDSGTTLMYLPEVVFKSVAIAVFAKHIDTLLYNSQDFVCFKYSERVDDAFPKFTFHFEGDLELNIYPHDYFLSNGSDWYCVGIRNGKSLNKDMKDMVILGDLVLSNRLFVYDLETQVIGWTEYDCSSGIKVEDEETGSFYDVKAHHASSEPGIHRQISLMAFCAFLVLMSW